MKKKISSEKKINNNNINENKISSKFDRFRKIAKEAAEQSFRNRITDIPGIQYLKTIDFSSYDLSSIEDLGYILAYNYIKSITFPNKIITIPTAIEI